MAGLREAPRLKSLDFSERYPSRERQRAGMTEPADGRTGRRRRREEESRPAPDTAALRFSKTRDGSYSSRGKICRNIH